MRENFSEMRISGGLVATEDIDKFFEQTLLPALSDGNLKEGYVMVHSDASPGDHVRIPMSNNPVFEKWTKLMHFIYPQSLKFENGEHYRGEPTKTDVRRVRFTLFLEIINKDSLEGTMVFDNGESIKNAPIISGEKIS